MHFIISYDIGDDKRRRHIVKILNRGAHRIQYSVFEGDLPRRIWEVLWRRLKDVIDDEEDSLLLISFCAGCQSKREWAGRGVPIDVKDAEIL